VQIEQPLSHRKRIATAVLLVRFLIERTRSDPLKSGEVWGVCYWTTRTGSPRSV